MDRQGDAAPPRRGRVGSGSRRGRCKASLPRRLTTSKLKDAPAVDAAKFAVNRTESASPPAVAATRTRLRDDAAAGCKAEQQYVALIPAAHIQRRGVILPGASAHVWLADSAPALPTSLASRSALLIEARPIRTVDHSCCCANTDAHESAVGATRPSQIAASANADRARAAVRLHTARFARASTRTICRSSASSSSARRARASRRCARASAATSRFKAGPARSSVTARHRGGRVG